MSYSPEESQSIGRILGANAQPGHVFLLVGAMGTGKTCLTQGVLWGLGAKEYARSPTFVLVAQYQGRLAMRHIDLYRLNSIHEIDDLDLDGYFDAGGLSVVEWADRVPSLFSDHHLKVEIEHMSETSRRITLSTNAVAYAGVLDAVRSTTAVEPCG